MDHECDGRTGRRTEDRTVRDKIRLISFTNKKSHMGFGLLSKSITLNDIEQRNDRRPALSLR